MLRLLIALIVLFVPSQVLAHGGGLNASGCHNERATGGYHCHRGTQAPAPRYTPPEPRYTAPPPARRVAPVARAPAPSDNSFTSYAAERAAATMQVEATEETNAIAQDEPTASTFVVGRTLSSEPVTAPASTTTRLLAPIEGQAQVLDADTIQIGTTRIRLYGIDAFEAEQMCLNVDGLSYECGGRATRALQEKIGQQTVTYAERGNDAFTRQLAVCRVASTDLSAWMVRSGHALAYTKYALDYLIDERAAKEGQQGAWNGSFELPWDYRLSLPSGAAEAQRTPVAPSATCTIKGNVSREGKRTYHMRGDSSYASVRAENWFCSEDEAGRAGFERVRAD
jgi:endonuclease YncB( thermonuclease family)